MRVRYTILDVLVTHSPVVIQPSERNGADGSICLINHKYVSPQPFEDATLTEFSVHERSAGWNESN